MTAHRLPGMSISADLWQALTKRADQFGTTRTELIRAFIAAGVESDEPMINPSLHSEVESLRRQLDAAQRTLNRQLEAAERKFASIEVALQRSESVAA